jgi:hypothetical protein
VRTKRHAAAIAAVALVSLVLAGPGWADGLPLPVDPAVSEPVTAATQAPQATVDTVTQTVAPAAQLTTQAAAPVVDQVRPVAEDVAQAAPPAVQKALQDIRNVGSGLRNAASGRPAPKTVARATRPDSDASAGASQQPPSPTPSSSATDSTPTVAGGNQARHRSEPVTSPAEPALLAVPKVVVAANARDATRPGRARPAVTSARPLEPPYVPPSGRDGATERPPVAANTRNESPAPSFPPRPGSLLGAAASALGGGDFGKTLGLVFILLLFLTQVLLSAIHASGVRFREPVPRRRTRPG